MATQQRPVGFDTWNPRKQAAWTRKHEGGTTGGTTGGDLPPAFIPGQTDLGLSAGTSIYTPEGSDPWRGAPTPTAATWAGDWYTEPYWREYVRKNQARNLVPGSMIPDWAKQPGTGFSGTSVFDFLDWYEGLADPTGTQAQYTAAGEAVDTSRADTQRGIGYMQEAGDKYLAGAEAAKQAALTSAYDTRNRFEGSETARRLGQLADPNYQAMSDEFVGTQRVKAGRDIASQQSKAINAAIAQGGGRAPGGGGLSPSLQMAARMRGAGDMATVTANLASQQLQFNESIRQWALGEMTDRDKYSAQLGRDITSIHGRVLPVHPFAAQMAALEAGQDVLYLDPSAPAFSADADIVDALWDDVTDLTGMTSDEFLGYLDTYIERANDAAWQEENQSEWNKIWDAVTAGLGIIGVFLKPARELLAG